MRCRSTQEYVGCSDHLNRTVVQHHPQGSIRVEPSEAAANHFVLADMDGQPSPRRMRAFLPGTRERRTLARPPQLEHMREARVEQGLEDLRGYLAAKVRCLAVGHHGVTGYIDPQPYGDAVAAAFEQNPRD